MSADDPTYVLQVRREIDQLLTEDCVLLDDGLLGRTERLGVLHPLADESAGGSHQSDVVEPSGQLERLAVGLGELQEVGHRSAQSEDPAGLGAQSGIERLEHLQAELNRVMQIKFQRLVHFGEPLTVIGLGRDAGFQCLVERHQLIVHR